MLRVSASRTAASRSTIARCFASKDDQSLMDKVQENLGKGMEKVSKAFESDGKVGEKFEAHGDVGGTADKAGGPLDKEGKVGKQFRSDGAVGGRVEKAAEKGEQKGQKLKHDARS